MVVRQDTNTQHRHAFSRFIQLLCHFHIPIISCILADANEQFQVPKHEGRTAGDMDGPKVREGGCSAVVRGLVVDPQFCSAYEDGQVLGVL